MRVTLPVAMAEGTSHEYFGSLHGITIQRSDGLPSPERSGSPELKARSSQWKPDRLAYASKADAHQIDDWPEDQSRKSEDVLVRYKDTRGSKGLSTRMDPHAWSDLPTDTDDEVAENATSPAWNGAQDVLSPKSASGTVRHQMQQQQPNPTATPRTLGAARTEAEGKMECLASEDHWGTVAQRQEADAKSDVERGRGVTSSTAVPVATVVQDDPSLAPCHAAEKGREGDGAGPPERVLTLRNVVPSKFSYMKSPPRAPSQLKGALDEQATMKMSHRYYTTGADISNRRVIIPVKSGNEEFKHSDRKRKEKTETILQAEYKARGAADSSSSTGSESNCSDEECKKNSAVSEEDAEESFRQMILQKYLVMVPGKGKKMQATKQKECRCKSPATKVWSEASDHRYFTGKNLHPISPSKLQVHAPKKIPPPHTARSAVRKSVSQPETALVKEQQQQQTLPQQQPVTGNPSSLVHRKSWSFGDLHHSKSLGDNICTLNGHPLTHREIAEMENSLTEHEKRAIELQIVRSAKVPKLLLESQEMKSSESSFPIEVKQGQDEVASEGQSNLTARSVEITTVAVADLPLGKEAEELGQDVSELGDLGGAVEGAEELGQDVLELGDLGGAVEGAEHHQWQGHGQGLSALALVPGKPEDLEKAQMPSHGSVLLPFVEPVSVDGSGDGGRLEERQGGDGGGDHGVAGKQAKYGNGFSKQKFRIKKVTAVVPFGSCEGDQLLPDVSLAGPPASHTLLELQQEVGSKQQGSKQRLTEQHCGSEMPVQRRRGFWDSSQELQREKQTLLKRLQELEAHHPCNRLKAMSVTKVQLTEEDAKRLRQEILEQEALIRGYQVENEKAVSKLKEVQLETKQKLQEMAEEKAHLAYQLANRHIQSYGADSASLHEKLQGALSRETALRLDLDKMRDSYSELEMRVKREESSRMKDLELKLNELHETLEAERQSYAGRKQAMIQQEELIASLQETISDQASKMRELTMRLEGGGEESSRLQKHESQQHVETLQNQVKRLEQSLRAAKKEAGLHALQREEATSRIINHLKVENEKIKYESVTRIRTLKQQIQARAAQSGHSTVSESELSALNRVKDLEKQVANLRIHYSRKVKELSDKLEEASKPKLEEILGRNKTSTDISMNPPSRVATTRLIQPAQGKALREAKERIALQEDVISQKDRRIKSLQTQLRAVESNRAGPTSDSTCTTPVVPSENQQTSSGAQESVTLPNKGKCLHTGTNTVPSDIHTAEEMAVLRRELEKSELTREVLQKACNESVEKAVLLTLQHQQALQLQQIRQSQLRHHRNSECQTPLAGWGDHRSGLEGMSNWLLERSSSEMANRAMEARLKVMSEELEEANSVCQQSPRMQQIMSLKKKVAEMEARQQQKEMEWQKILQETKQTSSIEQEYTERKWREALDSKSMEVEKIRLELNAIVEAAMAMQQQAQLQVNQKQRT